MRRRVDWLSITLLAGILIASVVMFAHGWQMGSHFGQHKISDTLSANTSTLSFGTITNPTTSVLYLTLTCNGNVVCRPLTPTISGNYFTVMGVPAIPATVAIGGTYSIGAEFGPPTGTGTYAATLYPNFNW